MPTRVLPSTTGNAPIFRVRRSAAACSTGVAGAPRAPETVFVVHGEPAAATALHDAIERSLGWMAAVPRYVENVRID